MANRLCNNQIPQMAGWYSRAARGSPAVAPAPAPAPAPAAERERRRTPHGAQPAAGMAGRTVTQSSGSKREADIYIHRHTYIET